MSDPAPDDPPYDFWDDFRKSILVAYEAIRARVAAGGPGYTPPPIINRTQGPQTNEWA
jgi:hypothetical protein